MENYTKYKLKSSDELASVLDGKDNLFVIACNKCFKEFETVDEPDCDEFLKFAADQGKNVTGSAKFDFLCNKMHTERKLQDLIPEGTENVVVISCGLGIQTVADLAGKPVVAASNTLNYRGHHGMALTKKSCDACAQCYLLPHFMAWQRMVKINRGKELNSILGETSRNMLLFGVLLAFGLIL